MFKLKIINKPKMIKMKCNIEFPDVVLANLQEKETTPTKETQVIVADFPFDGLSKVTVNPIPDEYIIPNGELEIIQNGTYDVSSKASAKVNVPEKVLGTKTITTNGTYNATDDNLDGYSQVSVETSGVDINDYFTDTISSGSSADAGWKKTIKKLPPFSLSGTSADYMFAGFPLSNIDLSNINTNIITSYNYAFGGCTKLEFDENAFKNLVTSNCTNISYMFYGCRGFNNAETIKFPNWDTSNVTNFESCLSDINRGENNAPNFDLSNWDMGNAKTIGNLFSNGYGTKIENVIWGYNIGKGFTSSSNRFSLRYMNELTRESILDAINKLYDFTSNGGSGGQLQISTTQLSKLTDEEKSIITNKGWTISQVS